jgi:hypothetical protein
MRFINTKLKGKKEQVEKARLELIDCKLYSIA